MYREPESRSRAEVEVDLCAASVDVVAVALIDAAHFEDVGWAVDRMIEACADERIDVVRAALVGIAAIARRELLPTDRRVWRAILDASRIPEIAGVAEDVMDDLEIYGSQGTLQRGRPVSDG